MSFHDASDQRLSPAAPSVSSPASLAECVPLIVRNALAVAAIGIDAAGIVSRHAPAAALVAVAEAATACGVLAAARAIAATPADTIFTPPPPLSIVAATAAVPAPPPAPPVPIALIGAALFVALARLTRKLAPFNENARFLSEPEVSFCQGEKRNTRRNGRLQRASPIAESREHPCQIVEPAVVHVVSGVPSVASNGRANLKAHRRAGSCISEISNPPGGKLDS